MYACVTLAVVLSYALRLTTLEDFLHVEAHQAMPGAISCSLQCSQIQRYVEVTRNGWVQSVCSVVLSEANLALLNV